jgi:hypothetical protein
MDKHSSFAADRVQYNAGDTLCGGKCTGKQDSCVSKRYRQTGWVHYRLRDGGFVGKACLNSIYINGTLSARLAVAEKAHFTVEAGSVTITAGKDPYGNDMCKMHQGDAVTKVFTLGEGETRSFRLSAGSGGRLRLVSI